MMIIILAPCSKMYLYTQLKERGQSDKMIIMMTWRIFPSWSLMKMIDVSCQEPHLIHEGDRMATVMGFLSEVSKICCVIFSPNMFWDFICLLSFTFGAKKIINYLLIIFSRLHGSIWKHKCHTYIQVTLGGLTSFPYVGTYLKPEKVVSKIQSIWNLIGIKN